MLLGGARGGAATGSRADIPGDCGRFQAHRLSSPYQCSVLLPHTGTGGSAGVRGQELRRQEPRMQEPGGRRQEVRKEDGQ